MSKMRPECGTGSGYPVPPYQTALYMIHDAVAKRSQLGYGHLHDAFGRPCAIGAFWDDNPKLALNNSVIDEVAMYNDSIPPTVSAKVRRNRVLGWLKWRLRTLAGMPVKSDCPAPPPPAQRLLPSPTKRRRSMVNRYRELVGEKE